MGTAIRVLVQTLRALFAPPRRALAVSTAGALLLAVPDLGRQLPVRDDPSRLHALLVDTIGVLSGTALQLAVIGLLAGAPLRRALPAGAGALLAALRRRPRAVLLGLLAAGTVSALLTLPASVAVLGAGQVFGPLRDPPLSALLLAQASDVVATALTAAYWGLLVVRCARAGPPA